MLSFWASLYAPFHFLALFISLKGLFCILPLYSILINILTSIDQTKKHKRYTVKSHLGRLGPNELIEA